MLMPETIPAEFYAPCGIDCMVCYVHLKKKNECHGCLGDENRKPERCRNCAIKGCAASKGLIRCHECTEFPCKRIKDLDRSYRKRYGASLIENSRTVRDAGLPAFMAGEIKRWSCRCGGIISLHDGFCSECGATDPRKPTGETGRG